MYWRADTLARLIQGVSRDSNLGLALPLLWFFQANINIKSTILDALRSTSSQGSLLYITFHSTAVTVGINSDDTGLREKHFWMPERSGLSKSGTAGALPSLQTLLSGPVRAWEGTRLLLVELAPELRAWEVVWSAWGGRQEVEKRKLSFQLADEKTGHGDSNLPKMPSRAEVLFLPHLPETRTFPAIHPLLDCSYF